MERLGGAGQPQHDGEDLGDGAVELAGQISLQCKSPGGGLRMRVTARLESRARGGEEAIPMVMQARADAGRPRGDMPQAEASERSRSGTMRARIWSGVKGLQM